MKVFLEYLEEKADGVTELINEKGFCKTAPATPRLLITGLCFKKKKLNGLSFISIFAFL